MALVIEVKVIPSSGRVMWKLPPTPSLLRSKSYGAQGFWRTGETDDRLKCYLKSPPEKGKANRELLRLIAKALKLPASACTILSGATSRLKRVRIDTQFSFNELLAALGIERQMRLF